MNTSIVAKYFTALAEKWLTGQAREHAYRPAFETQFQALVKLGGELRGLHLLESPKVNQFITTYPVDGYNYVEGVSYTDGKVFINTSQYFGNVPEAARCRPGDTPVVARPLPPCRGFLPARSWFFAS